MPRRERNNPTERIIRMLDELEEYRIYVKMLTALVMAHAPASAIMELGPEPQLREFDLEYLRQELMGARVRNVREYMRLRREGAGPVYKKRKKYIDPVVADIANNLPADISASAMQIINRMVSKPGQNSIKPPPPWQPTDEHGKFKPCNYGGVCQMETAEQCECLPK